MLNTYGRIYLTTSVAVVIELLILAKRHNLDPEDTVASLLMITPNPPGIDFDTALRAAAFIKEDNLTVVDAFHASYCGSSPIISSDQCFDRIGLRRIPLEKAK